MVLFPIILAELAPIILAELAPIILAELAPIILAELAPIILAELAPIILAELAQKFDLITSFLGIITNEPWYLPHRRPAKAQVNLCISTVLPEPSLFAHMKYGSTSDV